MADLSDVASGDAVRVAARERVQCEATKLFQQLLDLDHEDAPDRRARIRAYNVELTRAMAIAANKFVIGAVEHGLDSTEARAQRTELMAAWRDLVTRMSSLVVPQLFSEFRRQESFYDKFAPVMPQDERAAARRIQRAKSAARNAAFDAVTMEFELASIDMSGSTPDLQRVRGELVRVQKYRGPNSRRAAPANVAISFVEYLTADYPPAVMNMLERKMRQSASNPLPDLYAGVLMRMMTKELELQVYFLSLDLLDNPRMRPTWVEADRSEWPS